LRALHATGVPLVVIVSSSLSIDVRNVGALAGDEVVQLYVRDDYGSVTTFERSLRGFERVRLAPGQTRRVEFTLGPPELAPYDTNRRWTVEPGRFTVLVGASSVDIRQTGTFSVEAPDGVVHSRSAWLAHSALAGGS